VDDVSSREKQGAVRSRNEERRTRGRGGECVAVASWWPPVSLSLSLLRKAPASKELSKVCFFLLSSRKRMGQGSDLASLPATFWNPTSRKQIQVSHSFIGKKLLLNFLGRFSCAVTFALWWPFEILSFSPRRPARAHFCNGHNKKMEYLSSAVQGASASFARHRKLDAACTDEDKVAPGEQKTKETSPLC
jgi:hypothetical protein